MTGQTIYGLDSLPPDLPPLAVAIGVFDGVHRGHQALLHRAAEIAPETGAVPAALTFHPHPATVFAPDRTPPMLLPLPVRLRLLRECGAAVTIVVPFDHNFSRLVPDDFVREVIVGRMRSRAVIIGQDFRYGKDRAGDVETLRRSGETGGFAVDVIPPVLVEGVPARSTVIRQCLRFGDIEMAARLLGRPHTLWGSVIRGRQIGRTIGFPTVNLSVAEDLAVPGRGVYGGRACVRGKWHRAAISIGTNPTVVENGARTVEAFLMDGFAEDIYGEELALEFLSYIRPEAKFPSLDALIAQMTRDIEEIARRVPA